jgi:hypothetical protein
MVDHHHERLRPLPIPPAPPPDLGLSATEIAALLARGDASLATGDVASRACKEGAP